MALTTEQQAQVDMQLAIDSARQALQVAEANRQRRLDAIRIAQATLIENKRNLPVAERQVTEAEITAFADTLNTYVNS